jgi:hypothetical protein
MEERIYLAEYSAPSFPGSTTFMQYRHWLRVPMPVGLPPDERAKLADRALNLLLFPAPVHQAACIKCTANLEAATRWCVDAVHFHEVPELPLLTPEYLAAAQAKMIESCRL